MDELTGKIRGVTYADKSTGFHVLKVNASGKDTVIRGSFFGVNLDVGLQVKFSGRWTIHEKFGRQFEALSCELIQEPGRNGVLSYLISNVPSIGPVTASKLYDQFGDDLVEILNNSPEKVGEASYLTKNQYESIIKEWKQASASRTVAIMLSDLGFTVNQIKNAYTKWGVGVKAILDSDPYQLTECDGIGFVTADRAAQSLGIDANDMRRVKAITLSVLNDLCNSEGHMYVSSSDIQSHSKKFFKRNGIEQLSCGSWLSDSILFKSLELLQNESKIKSDDDRIYTQSNWNDEVIAADSVAELVNNGPRDFGDLESIISDFENERGLTLAPGQHEAYMMLGKSNIIIVSGFPGTGKTFLTEAFVHLFDKMHLDYALMSPTGIAAKRISQVTGKPASTIHRALGYKGDGSWDFHRSNKYRVDVLLVDEASMVDAKTFCVLMSALLPTTTCIIIGDSAQLPSVGAGYVLNNLLRSHIPHVFLKKIYRQAKQSDIITVAHQILDGQQINTSFNKDSEFVFLPFQKDKILGEVCRLASKMKEKNCEFQVISPMYDGDLGVDNLNKELRKVLNSDFVNGTTSSIKSGSSEWHEGDRVMATKNNYEKMIFNGDVGKIQRISIKNDEIEIKIFDWFDHESKIPRYIDKVFTYKVEEVKKNFKVSYACTVHRCVSPSTLVETPLGIQSIDSIDTLGEISTPRGKKSYINKVYIPIGPMMRITTKDGYIIESTLDHGFSVWDANAGYVRRTAHDLNIGDILPLKLGAEWTFQANQLLPTPTSGHRNEIVHKVPSVMSDGFAEFLGLMVADGTIYDRGFRLTKSSHDVLNRFKNLCQELFDYTPSSYINGKTSGFEVSSTYLSRWLLNINGLNPNNKTVPNIILQSSLLIQSSFLRGLFEDGTVNIKIFGDKSKLDHIELCTKFHDLFIKVKVMLLRFGIISGFKERSKKLNDGSIGRYYNIYIYSKYAFIFNEKIGFIDSVKKQRCLLPYSKNTHYKIPVTKSEIRSLRNSNGNYNFCTGTEKSSITKGSMTRNVMEDFLTRVVKKTNIYDDLRDRLGQHHSKIMKIEYYNGISCCIEVPDGNQFIQNGFCAWNCQGNAFDYVIVPVTLDYGNMLYRNLIYTALTRAKKKVFVLGDPNAFQLSVDNNREVSRNSNLAQLINSRLVNISA